MLVCFALLGSYKLKSWFSMCISRLTIIPHFKLWMLIHCQISVFCSIIAFPNIYNWAWYYLEKSKQIITYWVAFSLHYWKELTFLWFWSISSDISQPILTARSSNLFLTVHEVFVLRLRYGWISKTWFNFVLQSQNLSYRNYR